jgi:hypothetical protein
VCTLWEEKEWVVQIIMNEKRRGGQMSTYSIALSFPEPYDKNAVRKAAVYTH